jgi:predicted nucleotidyltransferase
LRFISERTDGISTLSGCVLILIHWFFFIFERKYIVMNINKKLLLTELRDLLKSRFADNLKEVVLFGSQINGTAQNDSDYDFLIILKEKVDWKTEREISDLCYEIDLKYNIITDIHILSESELSTIRGRQPIFVNALANGLHS